MIKESFKKGFLSLRENIIRSEFKDMNPIQMRAITHTQGALLVLAGAGSGKTTTIVNRIANMINFGEAYTSSSTPENLSQDLMEKLEQGFKNGSLDDDLKDIIAVNKVDPSKILAITFTNKAANELKERLFRFLGDTAKVITSCTFHSLCSKILREFAGNLGFSSGFSIYDSDDSIRLIKICLQELDIDEKALMPRFVLNKISRAKDNIISSDEYLEAAEKENNSSSLEISRVYKLYQKKLKTVDAMDFDDLIFNTISLIRDSKEVLEILRSRYSHVLVDEYQDTNKAQHVLVRNIFSKSQNVCAVGDDDQSIYSFRGAQLSNILEFEKTYPGARLLKLEKNYRSTKNILDVANAIIKNNHFRKDKALLPTNVKGEKIRVHTSLDENDEAKYITNRILDLTIRGQSLKEIAILYRANSQSSIIERALMRAGVPYKVVGGVSFYNRAEIKDIIAYFCVIKNQNDEIRLRRIVNTPKRLIGNITVSRAIQLSAENNCSFFDIARKANEYEELSRSSSRLMAFANLIDSMVKRFKTGRFSLYELYEMVLRETNFIEALLSEKDVSKTKVENIKELGNHIKRYEEELGDEATLQKFLEEASLVSDVDNDENPERVSMMTIHASKGLEFSTVFMPGMEEGIFPKTQNLSRVKTVEDIEEERRLAYVAITRAKERVYMINADARMIFGSVMHNRQSRFVREIPPDFTEATAVQILDKDDARLNFYNTIKNKRQQRSVFSKNFNFDSSFKDFNIEEKFKDGDRVKHKIFGEGQIVAVKPVAEDLLLDVNFDDFGFKKLMFKFSAIKKISS